ncbi:MAG: DegT/DnrJ/EryC1/StrS family aminotransferase [Chloroflexi bacterium]|nr:DegT/DnrJ/EryC1/StrS family aminotransferase [Chloroflexota bacterium]
MSKLAILGGHPTRTERFPIETPQINDEDIQSVLSALQERCLSIFSSSRIQEFEDAFAKYIGVKHAIAVTSGTASLQASLAAAGISAGDHVIVPVYTYAATVNAILLQGAVPTFVDVDPSTFNLDPLLIEEHISSKTKAIVIVDLFGNPMPRSEVLSLVNKHKLVLIEDCAQSTGARIHGRQVGGFGIGCHSFGEIKNITSAEGGMITTNDDEIARKARLVRHSGEIWRKTHSTTIGQSPNLLVEMIEGIDYEMVGHNYRMNALQASLGRSQLKRIDQINQQRRDIASYYRNKIDSLLIELPYIHPDAEPVFNRFVIKVSPRLGLSRNAFLAALIQEGVPAGVYYPRPLNRATVFAKYSSELTHVPSFPNAELVCNSQILLPCYPGLSESHIADVVTAINKILDSASDIETVMEVENLVQNARAVYFGQFFSNPV